MKLKITVDTLDPKSLSQLVAVATALSGTEVATTTANVIEMEAVAVEAQPTEEEIATAKKAEAAMKRKAARDKKKEEEAAAKLREQQSGNATPKPEENTTENQEGEKPEDSETTSQSETTEEVTKTMLQTLIRQKSVEKNEEHRPALKKELARLGAKNVSTLDEKHYAEFHQFMSDLK